MPCAVPGRAARATLIGAAASALALSVPAGGARAQTIIPPSAGPCVVVGTTATCTGDLAAGLVVNPPLTVVNVNTLTGDIAPAAGVNGIRFVATGSGVSINAELGAFELAATGDNAPGIYARDRGGGSVTVIQTGTVSTTGEGADGIYAAASGGGSVVVIQTGSLSTTNDFSDGLNAFAGGGGSVMVTQSGPVSTLGRTSSGLLVFASDGGSVMVTQTGPVTTSGMDAAGIEAFVTGGGSVTVTQTGDVTTSNANSDGLDIFVTSGGSATITQAGTLSTSGTSAHGIDAFVRDGGSLSINKTGAISSSGNNSSGISVYSQGTTSTSAGGPLTVTLVDSTIRGGGGTGAGLTITSSAGTANTVNTSGTVTLSSLAGTAINGGAGNTTVNNSGVLNTVSTGAIELGGGTNAFNNMGGATFNAGGIVNLGAGNLFSNSGTLSPGGSGARQTTALTGNLVQNGGGILLATVDPSAGTGDLVTVTGTANLSGIVQAEAIHPLTGTRSVTILSAAGGTTNNGLGLLASPALQASLSFPNANDVVLTYSIDFSVGGLNPNQTALANALNAAAKTGTRGLDPVLLPLLNNVFTIGDYRNALNQLLPEVMLNSETASLFASEDFVENLFSCRLAGQNHTALSEGECYWARPQGRFLDRDSDANTIGFDETGGGLAAGAQVAVAPNWFAGFALGYERASLDTDTGAETNASRFSGGLSLKYQAGSFLLGAAISGGLSGNDTDRPISIGGAGGFNATAEANYAIKTLTGQARAAYVFQYRDWYATPLVDVTATYLSRDGVTESGAGAANLAIAGSDETFFSVTPALEIGGDFALSETSIIRPYVKAGVSFYTDSDHGLTARFVSAPAGTNAFAITSDFDDVFADVAAGATAFFDNGSTLGLSYEGLISSDTQQHGVSVKGTIAF